MFRVRRIYDDLLPVNRAAIREVREIFREHFPAAPPSEIAALTQHLRNPFRKRCRVILYVAENQRGRVVGFATVFHDPVVGFCFLDYLAAGKSVAGRGVGAALYSYLRDESLGLSAAARRPRAGTDCRRRE